MAMTLYSPFYQRTALLNVSLTMLSPSMTHNWLVVDMTNHIEIHVQAEKHINKFCFPQLCFRIRETVFSAIENVFKTMQLSEIEILHAFSCPCPAVRDSHSASIHQSLDTTWFLRCSKTEKNVGPAEDKHRVWLETPVTEKEKPSLSKLLLLNVPECIGAKYRWFGTFLLNDGTLVDTIEYDCHEKAHRITLKILQEWLLGKGQPTTWKSLVQMLRIAN